MQLLMINITAPTPINGTATLKIKHLVRLREVFWFQIL